MADIPITATVGEFGRLTGISKRSTWRLLHSGELDSVMICGRRLIVMDSYMSLIDQRRKSRHTVPLHAGIGGGMDGGGDGR